MTSTFRIISLAAKIGSLALLCALPVARTFAQDANPIPSLELKVAYPGLKLTRPLWLEEAPDGSKRIFVCGQDGQIWIMPSDRNGTETQTFMDISDRKPHRQLEEGLLGLAFHPQFKTNKKLYIFYTQQMPKRSVISEFKVSDTDPNKVDMNSERVILEIPKPYWNHNGGCMIFGKDGYLYISVGDGGKGRDPHNLGQSLRFLYAKILRIDVDSPANRVAYGIPKDNPFLEKADSEQRPETWAYGFRNVWRFSFDRQTGDLWAGDVGQDKWEEVDVVVKGGNYGWSDREGFHQYKDVPLGKGWIEPIIEYGHNVNLAKDGKFPDHSIGASITGGYVYRGKKVPKLAGIYVYADYVSGTVWGLRYENGQMTAHGTLVKGNPARPITSFGEDNDGELYVMAYDSRIYEFSDPSAK